MAAAQQVDEQVARLGRPRVGQAARLAATRRSSVARADRAPLLGGERRHPQQQQPDRLAGSADGVEADLAVARTTTPGARSRLRQPSRPSEPLSETPTRCQASSPIQAIVRAAADTRAISSSASPSRAPRRSRPAPAVEQVGGPPGRPVQLDPRRRAASVGVGQQRRRRRRAAPDGPARPSARRGRRAGRPGPPSGRARAGTRPRRPGVARRRPSRAARPATASDRSRHAASARVGQLVGRRRRRRGGGRRAASVAVSRSSAARRSASSTVRTAWPSFSPRPRSGTRCRSATPRRPPRPSCSSSRSRSLRGAARRARSRRPRRGPRPGAPAVGRDARTGASATRRRCSVHAAAKARPRRCGSASSDAPVETGRRGRCRTGPVRWRRRRARRCGCARAGRRR